MSHPSATAPAVPAFFVAGTHSGVGKTTASLVLMSALRERGLRVQPFKVGPDFIDPAYHRAVTGEGSINLDQWMMGLPQIRRSFQRFASRADVAVIESMGALFDGENGTRERGSTGYLARMLRIPVILVVDIWGMTRSTGAVLKGFLEFDPRVPIAGVVFNRAGSRRHFEMVLDSLPRALRKLSLGYIPYTHQLSIPERHLGLLTVEENPTGAKARTKLLREAARTVDLDALIRNFGIRAGARAHPIEPSARATPCVTLGVARDSAFCFYYQENLELLEQAGARLVYFSPTHDPRLPAGLDGVYLGGGYPESFAAELARNVGLKEQLTARVEQGMPVYAECGGLMYLGRSLTTHDGTRYPMASLLPLDFLMDKEHLSIKYVKLRTTLPTLLGPAGITARGQEFHQSRITAWGHVRRSYSVRTSTGEQYREGFVRGSVLGSYVHLHFASNPAIPASLVARCLRYYRTRSRRDQG